MYYTTDIWASIYILEEIAPLIDSNTASYRKPINYNYNSRCANNSFH